MAIGNRFEVVVPAEGRQRRGFRGWLVLCTAGALVLVGTLGWSGKRAEGSGARVALGQGRLAEAFEQAARIPSAKDVAQQAIKAKTRLKHVSEAEARSLLEKWGFRPPQELVSHGSPQSRLKHEGHPISRSAREVNAMKAPKEAGKREASVKRIREDMEGLADAVQVVAERLKADEKQLKVAKAAAVRQASAADGQRNPPHQSLTTKPTHDASLEHPSSSRNVRSAIRKEDSAGHPPSVYMQAVYGSWHRPRPYSAGNINSITYADTTSHTAQDGADPVLKAAYPPDHSEYRGPAIIAETDDTQKLIRLARERMNFRGQSYFRDVFANRGGGEAA